MLAAYIAIATFAATTTFSMLMDFVNIHINDGLLLLCLKSSISLRTVDISCQVLF